MDADQDRSTAQTLLDYWVTTLYRATHEEQLEFILDEFDASLTAVELADDRYPYRPATTTTTGSEGLVLGTQRLIAECRRRIEEQRLVAVVGPDGSGKSTSATDVRDGLAVRWGVGQPQLALPPQNQPGRRSLGKSGPEFCSAG